MIYVTTKQINGNSSNFRAPVSFEDLLNDINTTIPVSNMREYFKTFTYQVDHEDLHYNRLLIKYPTLSFQATVQRLAYLYENLLKEDMADQYSTFHIPKHSGGMRRIDAPLPDLMNALADIKNTFQNTFHVLPHNAAHAYMQQRSTMTAMQLHQSNESKWFLKLDLKDFFPSHNHDYIMKTLEKIFPFSGIMESPLARESLSKLIKLGLLNDALPQGTPLSPLLTNVLMVPIDCAIQDLLKNFDKQHFVYTRYADDLTISAKYHFKHQDLQEAIKRILIEQETPFSIKEEKTRYGSSSGRNWNLGIMLNKDNNLTIGHKQNQRFRASVFSFFSDLTNGITWDSMSIQVLLGQISYYESVQPEYVKSVIERYSKKFNLDFYTATKRAIAAIDPF